VLAGPVRRSAGGRVTQLSRDAEEVRDRVEDSVEYGFRCPLMGALDDDQVPRLALERVQTRTAAGALFEALGWN
jgi:hypothetical protein